MGTGWIPILATVALSVLDPPVGVSAQAEVLLRLPDRGWGVQAAPEGFEFGPPRLSAARTSVWAAGDGPELGFVMTLVLEEAPGVADSAGCRARAEARLALDSPEIRGLVRGERSGMATLEYELADHRDLRVDQHNLHAFLYHDRACLDVHLSILGHRDSHRAKLEASLDAVALVTIDGDAPATGNAPTSGL